MHTARANTTHNTNHTQNTTHTHLKTHIVAQWCSDSVPPPLQGRGLLRRNRPQKSAGGGATYANAAAKKTLGARTRSPCLEDAGSARIERG